MTKFPEGSGEQKNKRLKVNAGQLLSMMITNIYYILLWSTSHLVIFLVVLRPALVFCPNVRMIVGSLIFGDRLRYFVAF